MSSAAVEPGQVIAGRYRLQGLLGQGAMGSVHRAVQLSVNRSVALKRLALPNGDSRGHIERFEREARALSRLSHPNTVRLFDYGTDERGVPFLVMELLRGSDLAEDLERQGPLRWDPSRPPAPPAKRPGSSPRATAGPSNGEHSGVDRTTPEGGDRARARRALRAGAAGSRVPVRPGNP